MEFYAKSPAPLCAEQLQRLSIGQLPKACNLIDRVLNDQGEWGEIYCLWGQFIVHREVIRDGLRFTLPKCPNALQWTLTAEADGSLIHCTINRAEHDAEFIETIELFVEAWQQGLRDWHGAL
ncbi:MAG: hypothetical protein H7842_12310 [Gammaproteobacteria bacterium SHHR-1]